MGPSSWSAVKLVLAAGAPIQYMVSGKGETHLFCNSQALQILKKDGKKEYSRILGNYLEFINRGVLWADKGWKNFSHYFDPILASGLGPWPDAKVECRHYFNKALLFWEHGNKKMSFFFLGTASHLVQDLCVPHHARGVAFSGHKEYENWVQENFLGYSVFSEGNYHKTSNPEYWIENNSRISRYYFPYVAETNSLTSYKMVTGIVLPLAQRSTAGFFSFFLDCANARKS